ncbi:MAG: 4Fe-4S binding protein [Firmicutes bacterium]|jgi:2-oxoglutarate ferredoxin oxidoreductase subunit delta|nr:4Fe-4S binding protein [Bacillota bacterium]
MFIVEVDQEQCKGCGLCVHACGKNLMILSERFNIKGFHPAACRDTNACTGCRSCALMCPDWAITISRDDA